MSQINTVFQKKKAYLGYLTAGDGGLEHSFNVATALIKGGVDILEIGVPFSDPIADGPTIQSASLRAIQSGTDLAGVLSLCKKIRKTYATPLILFSYYNPIFNYPGEFYREAKAAGVDGVLVVDLPFEESAQHLEQCDQYKLDPIFLISPSTPLERIQKFNRYAKGMFYYVSRNGTTGVKAQLPAEYQERIQRVKKIAALPIAVGFGISSQAMAREVLTQADGFVIGSKFVEAATALQYSELSELVSTMDPR